MLIQIALLLVDVVAGFFVFVLLARFHFQWLRVPFRNGLGEFILATTNWIVRRARRVIPALAGLDLATLLPAWLIQVLALWALESLRGGELEAEIGTLIAVLAALALVDLLRYSLYILVFAVIVQAVLSWVNPHSPVAPVFDAITRRFLRPLRRFIPPVANIDLTPLILIVLLQVLLIPVWHLRALVESAL